MAESSFSEEEEEKLQAAFSLEKQDLHLVLETISFILEQAVYHNPALYLYFSYTLYGPFVSLHISSHNSEKYFCFLLLIPIL
ncbi:hypothetical protein P7K49_005095 [Saguinus oedipus]|uniref:Uncharacterized protein n=1 Tax=Saguinus oedipus TaxID=9490 RepID=A0ABQ9WBQ3_SAGOE|nr:hypothetical protein P7K49_005095 [Saguinus oedipus]